MLHDAPAYATLPTPDVDRLRPFYEDTLGFTVREITPAGVFYQAGAGTYFAIVRSSGTASGSHTQVAFAVGDIEATVDELRGRGAVFEEYETPRTVDGIAVMPAGRAAWLRDPGGNLIGMIQLDLPA